MFFPIKIKKEGEKKLRGEKDGNKSPIEAPRPDTKFRKRASNLPFVQ